jgi:hypothetical protein
VAIASKIAATCKLGYLENHNPMDNFQLILLHSLLFGWEHQT